MKEVKTSGFQFSNPRTKRLLFELNYNFNEKKYNGLPVSYDVNISDVNESTANVELQIDVGQYGESTPFYMTLTIGAKFRWTDDINVQFAEKLLNQNAVTLLMSYARPIIAHTTGDAGFKPFNLPFVDLRDNAADSENEM